ncbi:hypothetical protein GCM10011410_21860 [Hoyosella rhizosphaerae]|uniref:Uncharacterized protein n=1 Tax=Hoyosella rhizosphaerae TaxID=1755582 RepID=A0A916UCT1_9ACTN|nr:hypothetical protein GCM10011410_21860 [Hoyosella rhizosphaerae]
MLEQRIQRGEGESFGAFMIMDWPKGGPPNIPGGTCMEPAVNEKVVFFCTGAQYGYISVETQALHHAPERIESGWEEIFDVQVQSETGLLFWGSGGGDIWDGISEPLTADGAGQYTVRIHARGRLENQGWMDNEVDEDYLIQVWKTEP